MSQPQWRLVANLGDVSPLEYGGCLVYVDDSGVYAPEAEWIVPPDDDFDDEGATWTVYRYSLDRCTFVNGILSDNRFHPESPAWFAKPESLRAERPQDTVYLSNVARFAEFIGHNPEAELIRDLCSDDIMARARAYNLIGEYHGFENLDSYPLELTRDEINERHPEYAVS